MTTSVRDHATQYSLYCNNVMCLVLNKLILCNPSILLIPTSKKHNMVSEVKTVKFVVSAGSEILCEYEI